MKLLQWIALNNSNKAFTVFYISRAYDTRFCIFDVRRNLLGENYTDCSFIFLYILCTMSIRQNLQKALGFAPSRAASKQTNMWGPDPNKYKW